MSNYKCPVYIKNGKVMDEQMTNVEKILHSKKLNYKDLTALADPYFKDNDNETINLYIDLHDILKPLYSPLLVNEFVNIRTSTKMNIISEIINIAAHYRHFFFSRYGKFTTIIMYYSSKEDTYFKTIDSEYKSEFYDKRLIGNNPEYHILNRVIKDCLSLVKEYFNYIPHVYLIDTGVVDPRMLPCMIKNSFTYEDTNGLINPNDFSILFSNNKTSLIDLLSNNDAIIFKHDRSKRYFINKHQMYEELGLDNTIGLPEYFIKYIMSIAGDKSYSIKNVDKMKEKKAFKYLCDKFTTGKTSLDDLANGLKEPSRFKNNMLLLDPSSYPINDYKKSVILKQFIDIIDFEYIKQETFNTFSGSSIVLLDYLFDGEEF